MYRAFLVGATGDTRYAFDRTAMHEVMRLKAAVAAQIHARWDELGNYVNTDSLPAGLCNADDLRTCRDRYVAWVNCAGSWGGQLELQVLANIYATCVWVYDAERGTWTHITPQITPHPRSAADRCSRTVILLYVGAAHYKAYLPPSHGAALPARRGSRRGPVVVPQATR